MSFTFVVGSGYALGFRRDLRTERIISVPFEAKITIKALYPQALEHAVVAALSRRPAYYRFYFNVFHGIYTQNTSRGHSHGS